MTHSRSRLLFLMFLAATFVTSLLAGPTGTLTGGVTDTSGGVIGGVKVDATNVDTNVIFPGETNAEGLYNIPNLPPGTYRVIVQKFAFRTVVKLDVELHAQDVIALNFSITYTIRVAVRGYEPVAHFVKLDSQKTRVFIELKPVKSEAAARASGGQVVNVESGFEAQPKQAIELYRKTSEI